MSASSIIARTSSRDEPRALTSRPSRSVPEKSRTYTVRFGLKPFATACGLLVVMPISC